MAKEMEKPGDMNVAGRPDPIRNRTFTTRETDSSDRDRPVPANRSGPRPAGGVGRIGDRTPHTPPYSSWSGRETHLTFVRSTGAGAPILAHRVHRVHEPHTPLSWRVWAPGRHTGP
jgi:hypothetical protein